MEIQTKLVGLKTFRKFGSIVKMEEMLIISQTLDKKITRKARNNRIT